MTDKQIKEINEQIKKAIERIENIWKKYDELREKYKAKEQECEALKATLKVIAGNPCLNINDCDGNCLPHCKWNAHKLAQQALEG